MTDSTETDQVGRKQEESNVRGRWTQVGKYKIGPPLPDHYSPCTKNTHNVGVAWGSTGPKPRLPTLHRAIIVDDNQGQEKNHYDTSPAVGESQPRSDFMVRKIFLSGELTQDLVDRDVDRMRSQSTLLQGHRNILQVVEVLQTHDHAIIVMDCSSTALIGARTLEEEITVNGRLDESFAQVIFKQLVSAVHFGHQMMIPHRGLHAGNIRLRNKALLESHEGEEEKAEEKNHDFDAVENRHKSISILVEDFQLQPPYPPLWERPETQSHISVNFVSPEALKQTLHAVRGPTPDLWALGVILYYMVAGHLPFEDPNPMFLFNKIERAEFRLPGKHLRSDFLKDVICSLLTANPSQRMTMPQLLEHPWLADDYYEQISPASENKTKNLGEDAGSEMKKNESASPASWVKVPSVANFSHQYCARIPSQILPSDLVNHCCKFLPFEQRHVADYFMDPTIGSGVKGSGLTLLEEIIVVGE